MQKISLYIPCYNAENYLKLCLESIFRQTCPIDEVLLINDGSTDHTLSIAKQFSVKIINHQKNKGLAAARNTAFKESKNEFVASLDSDCVAKPDWLEQLLKNFIADNIVGIGGMLIEKQNLRLADKWRMAHMSQHWGSGKLENPLYLAGNNNVYRKSAIFSVGLYDEKYISNYEDADITRRLISKGFRLIYTPEACVEHLRTDTVRTALATYWHWNFYNIKNRKTVKAIISNLIINIKIARKFLQEDIRKHNFSIIWINFIMIFYHLWLDIKYFKKNEYRHKSNKK
jgi:glycosyltransferase involved in cell wall biosynthesis